MESDVLFLVSNVNVVGRKLKCFTKKVNRDKGIKIDYILYIKSNECEVLFMLYAIEPVYESGSVFPLV